MKQLTNIQSGLFLFGGVLMVIGAGSYAFMWHQEVVGFIYLIGACLFGGIQLMQSYEGRNMVIKRLKRIMSLADLLFIFSGMIMIDNAFGVTQSFFGNYATYLEVVYNKWCCSCSLLLCLRFTPCTACRRSCRRRITMVHRLRNMSRKRCVQAPNSWNNQKKY